MSSWDIDPDGVAQVLSEEQTLVDSTPGQEGDFTTALNGVGTELNNAITPCTEASGMGTNSNGEELMQSALVASAIVDWFDTHKSDFESITTTISNVLNNTVKAVNAYQQHDEASALEFQRQAT
ncbi:hypothetical protein SAMN05216355_11523 [Actinomyces ruminicola]|uniref:Excreted virulence factor EspC, type VII ESX diderm n=1 Tax=Actinomyces ruminicola TaxID=332524 RepID=A0A1H0EC17_9ACTO|nr:DUF6507 family protein [Actinomyces ruminicola]SDN79905.1 hypothetical protein SAMN05216355_11523 [Actinomyces ruminicola]